MAETIIARLRMEGQRQYSAQAQQAARDTKAIGGAADQTGTQTQQSGKKTGGAMQTVGRWAKRGAVALGGTAAAATYMGLKADAANEMATVSFKGLLGSQQAAEHMMNRLTNFAAKTPFEKAQLVQAAQRWVGVGNSAKSVIPSMRAVGDAVAAVGGAPEDVMGVVTALTQMQNKGKASSEELQQIAERNIPAFKILGQQMGLTGQELTDKLSKGEIKANTAVEAIIKGMGSRYQGMMGMQSKTFTGMLSTIKDNVNMILGTAAEPLFKWLQGKIFPAIIRITNKLAKAGQEGGFKGLMKAISGAVGPANDMSTVISKVLNTFKALGKHTAAYDWAAFFSKINAAAGPMVDVILVMVGLFAKLLSLPGAPQAIGALAAMALAMNVANRATGGLLKVMGGLAGSMFQMVSTTMQMVTQILAFRTARMLETGATSAQTSANVAHARSITSVNTSQSSGLLLDIRSKIVKLAQATATIAQTVATKALTAAQWLLNRAMMLNPWMLVIGGIILLVAALVLAYKKSETFRRIVDAAFHAVKVAAMAAFNWVKNNWPLILAIITGPIGVATLAVIKNWDKIKKAASAVVGFIKSKFETVKTFLSNLFSGAGEWVSGIGRGIADWLNTNTPFGDRVEFHLLGKSVGFTIPALAQGGLVRQPGAALVGEAGPELVSLNRGAQVTPVATGGGQYSITVPVYLDRRQIALAMGSFNADQAARAGRAS